MWTVLAAVGTKQSRLLAILIALLGPAILEAQTPAVSGQTAPDINEVATRLLHMALHESVWGPPVHCRIRQQIRVYGHQLSGFGSYVRAGQGSGKLKLTLQIAAGDALNVLRQVSDGQLLHTLEKINGNGKRTIVDLDKVRDGLIINNETVYDPKVAMYLAIGGQAESIRKLCLQYDWYEVQAGELGGVPVWFLSGRLAKTPPAISSDSLADRKLFTPNQTALLPTEMRIAIGKPEQNSSIRYWLHRVEGRRSAQETSSLGYSCDLQILTEWSEPSLLSKNQLNDDLFNAGTSNDPLLEETDQYLPLSPLFAQAGEASRIADRRVIQSSGDNPPSDFR